MFDALQELSELSLDLQERNMDLYRADQKIKALAQVFEERQIISGPYLQILNFSKEFYFIKKTVKMIHRLM